MKNYVVYNAKGEILRTGLCPDNMMEIQAQEGEFIIEGIANDIEDKIIEGKVERKSEEEINNIRKRVEPDPKELLLSQKMNEILRRMAIEELKRENKL